MDPNIVTIMCCHEAAHGIAAYRRRFPFRYVSFTVPVAGVIKDTHLGVDSHAIDVAHRYLAGQGKSTVRFWASYLSVFAISKYVNRHYNGVVEAEAAGYAYNDFLEINSRLASFAPSFREQVAAGLNELINDVWGHPQFPHALEALANALLVRRHLTAEEVTATIEERVGSDLRSDECNPMPEHIRDSAFYDYTRRAQIGEAGTSVNDWLLSERALLFANSELCQTANPLPTVTAV